MRIHMLHWYPDRMNLYGDDGNLLILQRHLEDQGYTVEIDRRSIGEGVDLSQYGFVYLGAGTEQNQLLVLEDMQRVAGQVLHYAQSGGIFLLTGNAFELLGETIVDEEGVPHPALALERFYTVRRRERYLSDAVCISEWYAKPVVGFLNTCSEVKGVERPLFRMRLGRGNSRDDEREGFRFRNVLGTHLLGPVLVKNPYFLKWLVGLIGSQTEGFVYQNIAYDQEYRAYDVALEELMERVAEKNGKGGRNG
jgi:CobQ-like glutamine amidotransferase family enzyme